MAIKSSDTEISHLDVPETPPTPSLSGSTADGVVRTFKERKLQRILHFFLHPQTKKYELKLKIIYQESCT